MTEKYYPNIIFVNTGKKPTIEEIKEQLMKQKPLISDEKSFERHLIMKWCNDDE